MTFRFSFRHAEELVSIVDRVQARFSRERQQSGSSSRTPSQSKTSTSQSPSRRFFDKINRVAPQPAKPLVVHGIVGCSYEVTGLESCSLYELTVTACNQFGMSEPRLLMEYTGVIRAFLQGRNAFQYRTRTFTTARHSRAYRCQFVAMLMGGAVEATITHYGICALFFVSLRNALSITSFTIPTIAPAPPMTSGVALRYRKRSTTSAWPIWVMTPSTECLLIVVVCNAKVCTGACALLILMAASHHCRVRLLSRQRSWDSDHVVRFSAILSY